jgi:hypothetical protein
LSKNIEETEANNGKRGRGGVVVKRSFVAFLEKSRLLHRRDVLSPENPAQNENV